MATPSKRRSRPRGTITRLPSGALRVRVYAGIDPVTKRRHDLTEVVPAGPRAATLAEQALTRLLNQVDEKPGGRRHGPGRRASPRVTLPGCSTASPGEFE